MKLYVGIVAALFVTNVAVAQMDSWTLEHSSSSKVTFTSTHNPHVAPAKPSDKADYKNFTIGVYAGLNSTRFKGEEDIDKNDLKSRLGYQIGIFTRFGGRLYGQIGAEYLASSSNFFTQGDGSTISDIKDKIDLKYIQVPALVGFKLLQSQRGTSAIRLAGGAEFSHQLDVNNNKFNFEKESFNNSTINALGNLGFDIGFFSIDLIYHHGFTDVLKNQNSAKRRMVSASVGFKF
jgi:hypothetical protein